MKKHQTLKKPAAEMIILLLLLSACYEFDWVNQPGSTDPNTSFEVDICVYTTDFYQDEVAYIGISLPEGWTVDDSIPFGNQTLSGYFVHSDSLSAEMEQIEWPGLWRYWWVGEALPDPTWAQDTFLIHPTIHTDEQTGSFYLDYMLGDNSNGLNFRRSNNHFMGIDLPDTLLVTNSSSSQAGSLRWAIENIDYSGTILFDLEAGDTIFLQDSLVINKSCRIMGPAENPIILSGNLVNKVFSIAPYCSPHLTNLLIFKGAGEKGGAGYIQKGASPTFEDITFSYNHAGENGGALYFEKDCNPVFINAIFEHNSATSWGGAMYFNEGCEPLFLHADLNHNSAQNGGALAGWETQFTLHDVVIDENYAIKGGGINAYYSSFNLTEVLISNNHASTRGGGIYSSGGLLSKVENTRFVNNESTYGGGLALIDSEEFQYINIEFTDNDAQWGSGIHANNCDISIINGIIKHNESSKGVVWSGYNTIKICNTTATENHSSPGNCSFLLGMQTNIVINNSILWDNFGFDIYIYPDEISSNLSIQNTNIGDGEIMSNNACVVNILDGCLYEDPIFEGSGEHPHQLSVNSPCIDAGTPDTTGLCLPCWDLLDNKRCWDGDGDGVAIVDMGAYEFGALAVGIAENEDQGSIPPAVAMAEAGLEVQGYPNPTYGVYSICFTLDHPQKVSWQVLDIRGMLVDESAAQVLPAGEHELQWDAAGLEEGIYFCRVKVGNETVVKKLVKAGGN